MHSSLVIRMVYLPSLYNKTSEDDYDKAVRVAEYIVRCGEKHGLILSPKSMKLVVKSAASYAEHVDTVKATLQDV